jgi:hypothetical protein
MNYKDRRCNVSFVWVPHTKTEVPSDQSPKPIQHGIKISDFSRHLKVDL